MNLVHCEGKQDAPVATAGAPGGAGPAARGGGLQRVGRPVRATGAGGGRSSAAGHTRGLHTKVRTFI